MGCVDLKWGVKEIHVIAVIASSTGLKQLADKHPDVYISVGTVDSQMSESGLVLPGMGDAGDRQFGTHVTAEDDADDELVHPSKRKRSNTMD